MRSLILQHVATEPPGLIEEVFAWGGMAPDIVRLDEGQPLPRLNEYQALVVMGGPMNVYQEEEYPFLAEEDAFIRRAVQLGMPYLGICLGAQLLAKALGAPVYHNLVEELGFHYVKLTLAGDRDPLFAGCNGGLSVFQWHQDTFAIPQGAVRLATAESCANQAFRYGGAAYGLQFHVEVTPQMLEAWRENLKTETFSVAGGLIAPSHWPQAAEVLEGRWRAVLRNFLKIAANIGRFSGEPLGARR